MDEIERKRKRAEYMRGWNRRNKLADPEAEHQKQAEKYKRDKHYHQARYKRLIEDPEWRAANIKRAREWQVKNEERRKAYMRDYCAKNSSAAVDRMAQWKKDNPDKSKANAIDYQNRRRAKIENADPKDREQAAAFTLREKRKRSHDCYYCKKRFRGKFNIDHIMPLARGGSHSTDNLCVACPFCNRSKSDRPLTHIRTSDQPLLEL